MFRQIAKKTAGTFGVRIAATGLGFALSVLLARLLGATGFGIYTYAIAWTELLILPAILGLDNVLIRELAILQTKSDWGMMRGLLHWTNQTVLLVSVGLALITVGIAWGVNLDANWQLFLAFSTAMILVPLSALRNIRLSAMAGLHRIVIGLTIEMLLTPLLIIILSVIVYLFLKEDLTATWIVGTRIVATTITLAIGMKLLRETIPPDVKTATPQYRVKAWLNSAIPFIFLNGMFIIKTRTDILMLGAIAGAQTAGVYTVVSRGVQLINFISRALNITLSPSIASLYANGEKEQLQKIVTKSARLVLLVALPMTVGLIVCRRWYLLVFGEEFVRGQYALIFLACGQLVNAATGAVGVLLNMTNNERYALISGGMSTVINVVLNALLIPRWGVTGAAIATACSTIFVNFTNMILVRYKLGIHSTALGKII